MHGKATNSTCIFSRVRKYPQTKEGNDDDNENNKNSIYRFKNNIDLYIVKDHIEDDDHHHHLLYNEDDVQ